MVEKETVTIVVTVRVNREKWGNKQIERLIERGIEIEFDNFYEKAGFGFETIMTSEREAAPDLLLYDNLTVDVVEL